MHRWEFECSEGHWFSYPASRVRPVVTKCSGCLAGKPCPGAVKPVGLGSRKKVSA